MKLQAFTYILMGLTLVSCGDDTGSRSKGVAGKTAPAVESSTSEIVSGMAREKGAPQIKYLAEATASATLYRSIPDMSLDLESTVAISRGSLGRPNVVCGVDATFNSISARIADCLEKNKTLASWNAQSFGTSAEADWSLVAYTNAGKEVWQDQKTKAIWSPILGKGNWCQASGNQQSPMGSITVNCATSIPANESANFCQNPIEELNDAIHWRLPTRVDYLLADVDGVRNVLTVRDLDESGLWTATLDSTSTDRSKAWIYGQKQGTITSDALLSSHQIRCIGTTK